ncbi:flavin reductase family protein [Blastococcus sp. Marseille-P5729]|uniref:flavin reductase family protein n=1 Tax=Blastococcus sp. Marseille-P5729 TaxID=2086582 RepID=UPI000D1144FF|nr:flavin reductase family protein [Blastococcus sp. Marseille-P5729]
MSEPSDNADRLDQAPIDPQLFRAVLGNYASGVVVVTASDDGVPVGLTAQSFMSLSMDPPLVLFCPQRTSTSWPRIEKARHFAANILAEGQDALGLRFARSGIDKFEGVGWTPGPSGAPLLEDVLAHVDCTIEAVHEGGDHLIVVGRVLHLAAEKDLKPLVYFRSAFRVLGPGLS